MAINKKALADKIRRRFGYPAIKVELEDSQIYDAIDYTRNKFVKWATGQATVETFFTLMLSAGTNFYDLPVGVTEVITYNSPGITSGINTLFTIENYLYSQGYFEALYNTGGAGYTIISYHIARDFLDTVRRYTPDKYNWKYHPYTNQLEIHPAPASGNSLVLSDGTYDSPGFILLRSYMIEGSHYTDTYTPGSENVNFYALDWIFDYAYADCKERLGMIYRKFDQFQSLGNVGLNLGGNELVQEAKEEKRELEERLKLEETWDGLDISIGW